MDFHKTASIASFMIWSIIMLYFGIGGYVALEIEQNVIAANLLPEKKVKDSRGITFKSKESLQAANDERKAIYLSKPIIKSLPKPLIYLLTAMSFGAIGALTRLAKKMAIDKVDIKDLAVYSLPFLGILIGLIVLGLAKLVPSILLENSSQLQPLSLSFFSLLAGISTEKFFNWLSTLNDKIFN